MCVCVCVCGGGGVLSFIPFAVIPVLCCAIFFPVLLISRQFSFFLCLSFFLLLLHCFVGLSLYPSFHLLLLMMMMMKCCLMSSDVS